MNRTRTQLSGEFRSHCWWIAGIRTGAPEGLLGKDAFLKEKLGLESWNTGDLNKELPGANHFRWRLCIDPAESLVLRGTMTSEPDGRSTAEACFHKERI